MPQLRRTRILAAAVAVSLGMTAPAMASNHESDGAKTEPASVSKDAYFTAPATGALPATITNEFPPGVVCLVIPQVCGTQVKTVTGPVDQATPEPSVPDHSAPQPVPNGTLPVGMLGGKPRYTSYLQLALPDIPKGSLVSRFDLVLKETEPTYALESPAFRAAVLAGLATYQNRSPQAFTEFLASVAGQTNPLATNKPTGIELCAVTADWAAGRSQDATKQPPRDCIFGANGVRDAATRTWTFDLTFLAQAWLDGEFPNNGVFLGPIGAENLAFGDPDTSTNFQISLAGREATDAAARPVIRYSFTEGAGEDDLGDTAALGDLGDLGGAGGGGSAIVPNVDPFTGPGSEAAFGGEARPVGGTQATGGGFRGQAQRLAASAPRTPWYVWLLLPLGLGLAYAFTRSVTELPAAAQRRPGAMTRLVALRAQRGAAQAG